MRLRHISITLITAATLAATGWVASGVGAPHAHTSLQPRSEEPITTFERGPINRPAEDEGLPVSPIVGTNWISSTELSFHPLVPCRIVDTRVINAPLGNEGIYSFNANDIDFTPQGGSATSCGVPIAAMAVELNVTAVGSSELGHLRLYPFLEPLPNASIVNYAAGQQVANAVTVARCTDAVGSPCFKDFTMYAYRSVHVIVDVLGYYTPPLTAQINADGTVFGSSLSLQFVQKVSSVSGEYILSFDRDIRQCAFTATIGNGGDTGAAGMGHVEVHQVHDDPGVNVYVITYGIEANGQVDLPFQFVAHC